MKKVNISYIPVLTSIVWSWILFWIPSMIKALSIYNLSYMYDEKNLIIKKGIINKEQQTVPFYRITDIKADQNVFNYGNIIIQEKSKTVVLKYVSNPLTVSEELREVWESARKNENVVHNEIF